MEVALQQFNVYFFKVLAHPLRLLILDVLCEGPKSVSELQRSLDSEGLVVSQQLRVLRSKHVVRGIKDGNKLIYSIEDPLIPELLVMTRNIFNNQLKNAIHALTP